MATRRDSSVLTPIRLLMNVGSIGDLTDGQLLERFSTGRGETAELAFAALVERHGPMVWRVCRGVLADPHDTQDAFQATFLVLVRKARGLWVKDSLGAWLHQVAFRTASSALKDELRRRRHAGQGGGAGGGSTWRIRGRSWAGSGTTASRRDRQASRALPCANRALRSRGPFARAGGAASRVADRDRQEPAGAGTESAA